MQISQDEFRQLTEVHKVAEKVAKELMDLWSSDYSATDGYEDVRKRILRLTRPIRKYREDYLS